MITGALLTTQDGVTFSAAPEFVITGAVQQRAQDMAARGEWAELISATPPVYREWREDAAIREKWMEYGSYSLQVNPEPEDNLTVAAVYRIAITPEEKAEEQREHLRGEINRQIPLYTATETIVDAGKENDVVRYGGAASDKQVELENTDDADLDAFDPTIHLASPQADVGYSRFTISIAELTPWAGAPDNNLGMVATVYTEEGLEAEGAEARAYIVEGADAGAVLPFTQDGTDPRLWRVESRDGFKWQDPEQGIKAHLLWGAGSLQVSPTLHSERKYDRKAVAVRYGVAAGAGVRNGSRW